MFKILMMVILFVCLFMWEAPRLMRGKEIKELVVFSFLTLIGFVLSIYAVMWGYI